MMSSIFMYNWPFLHPFHKISTQTIRLFGCLRVLFKKGIFISSWFIPCNPSCIGWTPWVYLNNFCCLHLSIIDVFSCSLVSNYFVASWTVARQAPLSVEFSRQEYWSGVPFPTSGDLSNPGIKCTSLASPVLIGRFFTTGTTWEAQVQLIYNISYRCTVQWFTYFKGYTPLLVNIKYWLHSLRYTIYSYSLLIHSSLYLLIP